MLFQQEQHAKVWDRSDKAPSRSDRKSREFSKARKKAFLHRGSSDLEYPLYIFFFAVRYFFFFLGHSGGGRGGRDRREAV